MRKTLLIFKLKDEAGFTIIEVVAAAVILAFVIFATLKVVTFSLGSIARQEKRMRALHIAQECIGRLEGESFNKVVPENFIVLSGGSVTLNIDENQVVDGGPDENGDGQPDNTPDGSIGINDFKIRDINGVVITAIYGGTDSFNRPIIRSLTADESISINYGYYHLIDEGGTIPSSDGDGRKKEVIKLATDGGTLSNITVKEVSSGCSITPINYFSSTRELFFTSSDEGKSVWIYYLPPQTTDSDGDGYKDPTDTSIVGVAQGNFWDINSGCTTTTITPVKQSIVTEYWKQKDKIRKIELKTFIGK